MNTNKLWEKIVKLQEHLEEFNKIILLNEFLNNEVAKPVRLKSEKRNKFFKESDLTFLEVYIDDAIELFAEQQVCILEIYDNLELSRDALVKLKKAFEETYGEYNN